MATITLVQDPAPTITLAATSGTIVFGSNVTSGDLLVCIGRTAGTLSISDNLGDSVAWTQVAAPAADKKMWRKIAGATAACTVTVSGTVSGTIRMAARQYHSTTGWPATPEDGTVGTFSGVTATPTTSASTITAGSLASVLYAGSNASNDNTETAGTGYSDLDCTHSTNGYVGGEDQLSASGGSMTAFVTIGAPNASLATTAICLQGFIPAAVATASLLLPPRPTLQAVNRASIF